MHKVITPCGTFTGTGIWGVWDNLPRHKFGWSIQAYQQMWQTYGGQLVLDMTR